MQHAAASEPFSYLYDEMENYVVESSDFTW